MVSIAKEREYQPHKPAPRSNWWFVGVIAIALALLVYAIAALRGEPTERGLLAVPIVVLLATPMISRIRLRETRFDLAGIVFAGLGVKLVAVYGRFWMVDTLYGGRGDSIGYDTWGSQFASSFRNLNFDVDPGRPVPGTGFLRILTGVVYAVLGSDLFVGFIFFAMLSFMGCWFFYRAFAAAVPDGNHKRYAILIFFWPSVLFWPSAIGKEAWMILCLGLASWGAANVYRHLANGFPLLATGILGSAMPRPHIAIVVLAAVAFGFVVASLFGAGAGERRGVNAGFVTKVAGMVFILIAGALLAPKVATFLQIDDVGGSGFSDSLEAVQQRTSGGGSDFTSAEISSPLDYPWALVTVLFRPFPYEVASAATLISAVEGLLLLGLMAYSLRQVARIPALLVRNAYVAYAAAFTFMFVYVFAFISNFGILARQRTQLLPFLFVLIALPTALEQRSHRARKDAEGPETAPPSQSAPRPPAAMEAPRNLAPPRAHH